MDGSPSASVPMGSDVSVEIRFESDQAIRIPRVELGIVTSDGERLLNIGKAYSGLTDVEIAEMTKWFLDHTIEDQGFRRTVEPKIVLEVAFNNIMKSDRHSSGYALRFPRIVRLRPDKLPEEADTMERVKEVFAKQGG